MLTPEFDMARIPLSDIPNAPKLVPQPTGAGLGGVNLSRAQSLLSQDTISPDAFSGPGRGLQALAQGVASTTSDLSTAAHRLREQQDQNEVWMATDALNEAYNAKAAEIAANPTRPEEYGALMAQGLDEAYKGIAANKKLSPQARQRIEQVYNRFRVDSVGRMQLAGAKQVFETGKLLAGQRYAEAVESGNTAAAIELVEQHRGTLFFEAEADALTQNARQKGEMLAVQQLARVDPDAADEMLRDPKQTGSIPEVQRLRLEDATDTERRRINADNWEALATGVAEGTIRTPEDAENIFGKKFAVQNAGKIKRLFAANPDMEQVRGEYLRIGEEIAQIDPSDPEIEKRTFDLRAEIHSSLPEGFRKDSLDALNSKLSRNPDSVLRSQLSETLNMARSAGVFGQWDEKDVKDGDLKELDKKKGATAAMYRIKQEGEAWLRANPTATSEGFGKWFNERMSREVKQAEPGWWGRNMPSWLGGGAKTTPAPQQPPVGSRVDDKLKQHGMKAEPTPAPSGSKVTSYGYSSDPWKDSNSMKGIGAWSNQLEDGLSFAASPDVEAALKKQGVGKGDLVEVTLSNGETLRVRWDDRTAQDGAARKLGLNPLRGRWDIYSKAGPHAMDGAGVASFRKVQS